MLKVSKGTTLDAGYSKSTTVDFELRDMMKMDVHVKDVKMESGLEENETNSITEDMKMVPATGNDKMGYVRKEEVDTSRDVRKGQGSEDFEIHCMRESIEMVNTRNDVKKEGIFHSNQTENNERSWTGADIDLKTEIKPAPCICAEPNRPVESNTASDVNTESVQGSCFSAEETAPVKSVTFDGNIDNANGKLFIAKIEPNLLIAPNDSDAGRDTFSKSSLFVDRSRSKNEEADHDEQDILDSSRTNSDSDSVPNTYMFGDSEPQPIIHSVCGDSEPQPIIHSVCGDSEPEPIIHSVCGDSEPQPIIHSVCGDSEPEPIIHSVCGDSEPHPIIHSDCHVHIERLNLCDGNPILSDSIISCRSLENTDGSNIQTEPNISSTVNQIISPEPVRSYTINHGLPKPVKSCTSSKPLVYTDCYVRLEQLQYCTGGNEHEIVSCSAESEPAALDVTSHADHKPNECDMSFKLADHCKDHETTHGKETISHNVHGHVCGSSVACTDSLKSCKLNPGPFQCDLCDESFTEVKALEWHKKTHNSGPKLCLLCDVCGMLFAYARSLESHKLRHSDPKPFKCDACNKSFAFEETLKVHEAKHTGEKLFSCDVCNQAFRWRCHLRRHKSLHASERPYKCTVCHKTFRLPWLLKSHMMTHAAAITREMACDECDRLFISERGLKYHKLSHTGHKPFQCDVCGKAFLRAHHLTQHKTLHSDEKQFICDVCGKAWKSEKDLTRHRKIHFDQPGQKQMFSCDVCSKTFKKMHYLTRHRLIHSGEKPHVCDACGKSFKTSMYLNNHKVIHSGKKPYVCDVCDKAFSQSSSLWRHKLIHTGQKPYSCDQCELTFNQRSSLNRHKLTHTGVKPHVCTVCAEAFFQACQLKQHMTKHTGERNYKCDVCTKTFAQSSSLKQHELNHHVEMNKMT